MATKRTVKKLAFFDFSAWNFIIFLLLGFILIVVVATAHQGNATDLGVQAVFVSPIVSWPDPSQCRSGWRPKFERGKCPVFVCPIEESVVIPSPATSMEPLPTGGSGRMRIPPNEQVIKGPWY